MVSRGTVVSAGGDGAVRCDTIRYDTDALLAMGGDGV